MHARATCFVSSGSVDFNSSKNCKIIRLRIFFLTKEMSKEDNNTQILFVKRPHGIFDPKETFTIVKTPLPTQNSLKDGQLLVKIYYVSLDPGKIIIEFNLN